MSYFALISYVIVMSVTPGPNNLLLTASGVNFGIRRTIPMSLGVSLGSGLQCFIALSTFHFIFAWLEGIRLPLAVLGCTYLLWLSWQLYVSAAPESQGSPLKPMTFMQMALFQWVNPKAWLMAINIAILFTNNEMGWQQHAAIALLSSVINFPCVFLWVAIGESLKKLLKNIRNLYYFNCVMAALMALTALWLLVDELRYFYLQEI